MSLRTVIRRGRKYYAEYGPIRTIGAVAGWCGREINSFCRTVDRRWRQDRKRGYPFSLRLEAARNGFSADRYLWLGLTNANVDTYLNSREPLRRINAGYLTPFHNKYVFHLVMQPVAESLPTLYGTITGGEFRNAPWFHGCLDDVLDAGGKLVVKPVASGKGFEVSVVKRVDGAVHVNGGERIETSVTEAITDLDGYVITEFVDQQDYAERIFADVTNTIRIHSLVDPETYEVSLLRASHRFGSAASVPTDNWSRGGYIAPIDVESGEIRRLIVLDDPPRSRVERHPETNVQVAGVQVPRWNELRDTVREAAELHLQAPLIGWDVAVTDDGPVIIEANARPSIVGLQLTEGILTEPGVRKLIEQY